MSDTSSSPAGSAPADSGSGSTGSGSGAVAAESTTPDTMAGTGQRQQTGVSQAQGLLPRISEDAVSAIIARYPRLEDKLTEDWEEEKKALKDAGSYAEFKPLVLILDSSLTEITTGLGYVPKDKSKTGHPCFDWNGQGNFAQVLHGIMSLAAALSTKSQYRETLFNWLKDRIIPGPDINEIMASRHRSAEENEADDKKRVAEHKDRAMEKVDAFVTIVVALFKILTILWPYLQDVEDSPKRVKELEKYEESPEAWWTKFGRPLADALIEILGSAARIMTTDDGPKFLKKFADGVKNPGDVGARMRNFAEARDAAIGLSEDEVAANAEVRQKKASEAKQARDAMSQGQAAEKGLKDYLTGIANFLDAVAGILVAWKAAWPSDLAGEWVVDGADDDHATWLLTLEKAQSSETIYNGKLKVRAYAGDDRSKPTDEDKAELTLELNGPVGETEELKIESCKWKGKIPKDKKNSAVIGSGVKVVTRNWSQLLDGKEGKEELTFESTRSIHCVAASIFAGRPIHIKRAHSLKQVIDVIVAGFTLASSITHFIPNWDEKKLWFIGKIEMPIRTWASNFPWLQILQRYLEFKLEKAKSDAGEDTYHFTFGLKELKIPGKSDRKVGLSGTWDLGAIFDYLAGDEVPGPNVPNPGIPVKVTGCISLTGSFPALEISGSSWNPDADPNAGKQGLEDKLGELPFMERVDEASDGIPEIKFDMLMPTLKAGDAASGTLPGIVLPFVVYIPGDKKSGEFSLFPLKLEIKLECTVAFVVNFFPPLRALLFAAEMGWAVGTYLRGQLLQTEWGRGMEAGVQAQIADALSGSKYLGRANEAFQHCGLLRDKHPTMVTYHDTLVAQAKAGIYVWYELDVDEERFEGTPPDFIPSSITDYQRIYRNRLNIIRSRIDLGRFGGVVPTHPLDLPSRPDFLDTEAEALLYCFLWGDETIQTSEVKEKIDEAERRHELHGLRAELLRFYLGFRDQLSTNPQARQQFQHGITKKASELSGKVDHDSIEYKEANELYEATHNAHFSDFLHSLTAAWPSPNYKEDFQIIRQRGGTYSWQFTRPRANETDLRVRFFVDEVGFDDTLATIQLTRNDRPSHVARHRFEGGFDSTFRENLWDNSSYFEYKLKIYAWLEQYARGEGTERIWVKVYQTDNWVIHMSEDRQILRAVKET